MRFSIKWQILAIASRAVSQTMDSPLVPEQCKCYPSDTCWPSADDWTTLNKTVNGRLFLAIPPGAACYGDYHGIKTADASQCQIVASEWTNSTWAADQQTLPMTPFWSNNTCEPSNSTSTEGSGECAATCLQGLLPQYVIMAKVAGDIAAGVKFAKQKNLRLVIRNTGHCFMGRSTGFGSLAINTHGLQTMEFIEKYNGAGNYTGSAVRVGAGVMFQDLYQAAWTKKNPVDVLGGECPTVGIAGGFIQGGGQGPLSGIYGLGSDNALSFTVVLANGDRVSADARTNSDLYWALKGGGMSTYAVVTSVIVKTFPVIPVTGMALNITGEGDTFWEGIKIWHSSALSYVDAGIYNWYTLLPGSLVAQPFVAPNLTVDEFKKIVDPMLARLTAANVTFNVSPVKTFPKFGDLYNEMWFNAYHGSGSNAIYGGRMISRKDVANNSDNIIPTFRKIMETFNGQVAFGGHLVNPGHRVPDPDGTISAVHPVFRDAADIGIYLYFPSTCLSSSARLEAQDTLTNTIGDMIRAVTPNSAVYSNEGDINEPKWQDAFWGPIYPKLLSIKEKYDPDGVFWAKSTPGSERWLLHDETRLCKAA